MPAGPPYGNKNAEKWIIEEAETFFNKAIALANKKEIVKLKKGEYTIEVEQYKYDFIGEVARELKSYKSIFTDLKNKFPELQYAHIQLIETLEANCFWNSKRGAIKEATAIVNLKSNHKWTDRADLTTNDEKISGINYIVPDANNDNA